jgi:hypothetical protein
MKKIITFLVALISFQAIQAQTAEDSVKAVINDLFNGMRNADAALVEGAFSDSAILQTIILRQGKTIVRNETVKNFATFVGQLKKDSADERITFETISIDGSLASVWTPYKFYYNGQFSHCGANSFQLVRFEGRWKIQYLIDTRRRQGCE